MDILFSTNEKYKIFLRTLYIKIRESCNFGESPKCFVELFIINTNKFKKNNNHLNYAKGIIESCLLMPLSNFIYLNIHFLKYLIESKCCRRVNCTHEKII